MVLCLKGTEEKIIIKKQIIKVNLLTFLNLTVGRLFSEKGQVEDSLKFEKR
jgi:hypothetical protein